MNDSGNSVVSVQDLLDRKGERIISVARQTPVAEITRLLSVEKIGTVLVMDEKDLDGIISERDIIEAFSRFGEAAANKSAEEIMTAGVVTCAAEMDIAEMPALMSRHTIRHLPVVSDGAVVGLLSVRDIVDFQRQMLLDDIARREQDEMALREAHARLEAAFERRTEEFRMARDIAVEANNAKSIFLANMSHELRTPLNAIIGFSEVMTTEALGPVGCPQYRDYAADINEAGHHLLSLINDLLDMAKTEAGKEELFEEQVDIAATVDSTLKLVRGQADKSDISMIHEVAPDIPYLWADARKLQQILTNLLSNAVKFTEAGGEVSLKVWCRPESGCVIQVADTGIGIAPKDIPKALSQFGQIDNVLSRKFDGTGLGLPLAKTLVELHGGSLDLQSEPGVGTTVTVRLPASRIVPAARQDYVA